MSEVVDVSVLIPNYNHAHYLPDCLNAILFQSFSPKEILIIDDASKDNSIAVIKEYQKNCSRIKLVENKMNQGPAIILNQGIGLAKGKYLAFCSADDHVLPGFIEEGYRCLEKNPNVGICCSDPSFFKDQKPYRFLKKRIAHDQTVVILLKNEIIKRFLYTPLWLPSHASLFRKEFVIKAGGFQPQLCHLSDWYLNLKIAFEHGIVYVPRSFGAFRITNQSYGSFLNRSILKKILIYKKLFTQLSLEPINFREAFRKSGALGNISASVLLYLCFFPLLWKYIPQGFVRKVLNLLRKVVDAFRSEKPSL